MLAVVLILALSSNVLAAEYDFHNLKDSSKSYGKLEFATSTAKRLDVAKAPGDYAIEAKDGKLYEYKKVIAKMSEGKTFEEAIAEIGPVEKPTEGLKVVSVSAINANTALAGATVKPNESFTVAFNGVLDEKTITNENITLKKGALAVPVTLTLSEDKKSVKVVPTQPLDVKTEFSLVVTTAVKAATGEALAAESTTSFNTADAVVLSAFKINNKTLEQGPFSATDLVTGGITVVANKDLDSNTVNTSTVKLYNKTDGKYVPLTDVTYISASKTVKVTPLASAVENNKAYELRFDGVLALDGTNADGYVQPFAIGSKATVNVSVPTDYDGAPQDKVYPGLTSSVVKVGTTNNATNDADHTLQAFRVTVNFNGRAIDTATLTAGSIKLVETDENGTEVAGSEVAGTISYDAATFQATFVPNAPLKEKTNYKVTATKAIKDILGIEVTETSITFKTGDFTAPTVVSSNVDTGARLASTTPLKVTFSEKMTPARLAAIGATESPAYTATGSVQVLDKDGKAIAATVELDPADTTGKTYNIAPAAAYNNGLGWKVNETYTVKINGKNYNQHLSAADEAGNPLASEYSVTFTTADTSIPAVTSVKAYANGYTGAKPNKELLGSTASNPVTGIEEDATTVGAINAVDFESIYIQFNRVIDGGFLDANSYEVSTDGGKNYGLNTLFTPTIKADDNGKNTIVQLKPATADVIKDEKAYSIRLKKGTATVDGKKLVDNVTVYYSTESAKPALASTNALQVFTANTEDTAGTKADIATGTTTALELNNGIALKFTEPLRVGSINNTNIKIEDVTDAANPVALVGAFYEDIEQITKGNAASDFKKTLLSTTATDATKDAVIYWTPSSDDNKFKAGRNYKLTIDGVKDAVGNPMAAPYIAYFTVADTAAPTVVSTSVKNGEEGVSVDPTFTVTFSKDVTEASVKAGIKLKQGSDEIPATVKYDKATKTATVTPLVYLNKLTGYTLNIAKDITDGKNTIGADTVIAFTTENVEKKEQIISAVYKETTTTKTLTLTLDKPFKFANADTALAASDFVVSGGDLTGASFAVSLDKKTIVITAGTGTSIIPGVTAIAFDQTQISTELPGKFFKQSVPTGVTALDTTNSIVVQQ